MTTEFDTKKATAFFQEIIEYFCQNNEKFYNYVKSGFSWSHSFRILQVGNYTCRIAEGSERTTMIFDDLCAPAHSVVNNYILKISAGGCGEEQFEHEIQNYESFKACGFADLCTKQEKVNIEDIFPIELCNEYLMSSSVYVVERADVDEEYNNQCLREYIFDNIEYFNEDLNMYSYEWYHKGYDELDPEQKKNMVWEFVYNDDIFSNMEKLSWLLSEYNGIDIDRDYHLYNLIADIGDFHMGNISLASGQVKLVDYGWGESSED